MISSQPRPLVSSIIHLWRLRVCSCFPTDFNICLECASSSRVPVRSSGISGLFFFLFCFDRKVPHAYFRPGLSHTITRCARHVSCSLHTWMNNGVNWNKVENKSHCDPFNPHIYTCMRASCSCIGLLHWFWEEGGGGWFFSNVHRNCVCVADPLASVSHQERWMQVGRKRSLGKS